MKKYFLLLLAICSSTLLNAQIEKFQAAYIYNICKYLEWPSEYTQGNFVIGVLSSDPITVELKKIAETKKYINQTIEIREFKTTSNIAKCHVLFVPEKKTGDIGAVLGAIGKNNTLLVTSKKGAIESGSAINFVLDKSKLKFELKKANIINKGIKVNSDIEKLALKKY